MKIPGRKVHTATKIDSWPIGLVLPAALAVAFAGCGDTQPVEHHDLSVGMFNSPILEDKNPDPKIVEVELRAAPTKVEYVAGVGTTVWAYNGTVPGPRIIANVGDTLVVHFTNELPSETTVHWHGLEVPADMDGTPLSQDAVAANGGTFTYRFTLLRAGTYWYHPHIRSYEQVEKGLQGMLIVRDPAKEAELGLPDDALDLVLDDVLLNHRGQVAEAFPVDPVENALVQVNGREGNILLVNGRRQPSVGVYAGRPVRLRMVNAANSRYFRLSVENHHIFQIGGDNGLLPHAKMFMPLDGSAPEEPGHMHDHQARETAPGTGLLLTPGERADVVFTPQGEVGDEFFMTWNDFARGRHAASLGPDNTIVLSHIHNDGNFGSKELVRFEILGDDHHGHPFTPPDTLTTIEPIDTTNAETIQVQLGHGKPDANGNIVAFAQMIDGKGVPFPQLTTETALQATVGKTYVWEVTNLAGGDHNFHPHGFSFQPMEIEYVDMDTPENNRVVPFEDVQFKDTIRIPGRPGAQGKSKTILRLATTFDDTGREGRVAAFGKEFVDGQSGGWFVHCHMLEHGARGMATFLNLWPQE